MGENILIVASNSKSFTTVALISALEAGEVQARAVSATKEDFATIDKLPPICIVNGGGFDNDGAMAQLIRLRDMCLDQRTKVMFVATDIDEMDTFNRTFAQELVIEKLIRPIVPAEVAELTKAHLDKLEQMKDRKSVLVVDDSGMVLRSMMTLLEKEYNVSLANSATTALAAISKHSPDLVLLDYEMPVISGAKLLEMIRAEESMRDLPVFFLTSKGDPETVKSVLGLKPEGYLLKTTPSNEILKMIRQFFEK
ncbi:MAG: response regulator [Lachnospiraceae bacterium]|nr:response regulator [Lachnospiraceae bacterium]